MTRPLLKRLLQRLFPGFITQADVPSLEAFEQLVRDVGILRLNSKAFGYELASRLAAKMPVPQIATPPAPVMPGSKACTQADYHSDWLAYWNARIGLPLMFHRKLWEYAFIAQTLYAHGVLRTGTKGLGLGCGEEPLPSLFAAYGCQILATDAPPGSLDGDAWRNTAQHTSSSDQAFKPGLISRQEFDRLVTHDFVDMNALPKELQSGYDFTWSTCACEHLGSIKHGLDFLERVISVLRPGGISVHTTEFNYSDGHGTIDHRSVVLFQRSHFKRLADHLTAQGHQVLPLDLSIGEMPLDQFIDVPPYSWDIYERSDDLARQWRELVANGSCFMPEVHRQAHLKVAVEGYPCTCFGLAVIRGP